MELILPLLWFAFILTYWLILSSLLNVVAGNRDCGGGWWGCWCWWCWEEDGMTSFSIISAVLDVKIVCSHWSLRMSGNIQSKMNTSLIFPLDSYVTCCTRKIENGTLSKKNILKKGVRRMFHLTTKYYCGCEYFSECTTYAWSELQISCRDPKRASIYWNFSFRRNYTP